MSQFGTGQFGTAVFGGDPSAHLLFEVDAEITSLARRLMARGRTDGTSIQVITFSIGKGGTDPFDYRVAVPVNPDADALDIPVNIGTDPTRPITYYERPNPNAACCFCQIDNTEVVSQLGEIGLWANIENSPTQAENAAPPFLAAIAHFPLVVLGPPVAADPDIQYVFRVNVQF